MTAHDNAVARDGAEIWIGAEPTFTDATSEAPEWLFAAMGGSKRSVAGRMLAELAQRVPGCAILRPVGKHYPGEETARWSMGYYAKRNGDAVWRGPPDPLLAEPNARPPGQPLTYRDALITELETAGLSALALTVTNPLSQRVVFRTDGGTPTSDVTVYPDLIRRSVHQQSSDELTQGDRLAEQGLYLVCCGLTNDILTVELPTVPTVDLFVELLRMLGDAARAIDAGALMIRGFPPPVDASVAWETLAPDPAVVEINTAPAASTAALFKRLEQLYEVAEQHRLAPFRLHYNGLEADSGGGGQLTLGGPSPERSPFFLAPQLLPNLLRYFNRHPGLSFLYATLSVGSASQAPRADESQRDAFKELSLALELLKREPSPSPTILWGALAPFLTDPSGNTHRAELNIEKLWNPWGGPRGTMGLVEFRALRMCPTPQASAALAALIRATAAMLSSKPYPAALIDWGDVLHERFALPLMLTNDIVSVLEELEAAGYGLDAPITRCLLDDGHLLIGVQDLPDCRLEVRQALEFWPLVGDVATQQGGSRTIDASTARIELRLSSTSNASELHRWRVGACGWHIPLHEDADARGPVLVTGLRYRTFYPQRGLHPTLEPLDPLDLSLSHPEHGHWRLRLYAWHADGQAYPGLPADIPTARERRQDRLVLSKSAGPLPLEAPPRQSVGQYSIDLRWR